MKHRLAQRGTDLMAIEVVMPSDGNLLASCPKEGRPPPRLSAAPHLTLACCIQG